MMSTSPPRPLGFPGTVIDLEGGAGEPGPERDGRGHRVGSPSGALILRHFQVKCGDIDTKKWRESKDELEEIFQVPLQSPQLPELPQRMEGVLVTNGHANPHVEPRMTGWFKEQRETHGRCVRFMHLDGLVDWVVESRLVNELRAALQEEGVNIEAGV